MTLPARQEGDTSRSYAALCAYCELGPTRSLEKLVQYWTRNGLENPPTKWLSTLKRWSTDGDWQRRSQLYDSQIIAAEDADRAALRRTRRAALEEADFADGLALRKFVIEALKEAPKFLRRSVVETQQDGEKLRIITLALAAGPGELARALKLSSDLQRLAVGAETERTATTIEIRYVDEPDHPPDTETTP